MNQLELFETLKNGEIKKGQCLLTIDGQTFRVYIRSVSFEMNYSNSIPEFQLNGYTFDDADKLAEILFTIKDK